MRGPNPGAQTQTPAAKPEIDELIVEAEAVLTVDSEWNLYSPGYLAVREGRISAIGPAAEAKGRKAARRIDAGRSLLMPGFVNTHTHIAMAAFRGACEDAPDRLTRFIFPMERNLVTQDLTYWS
ncbi:MAG: hypothetical protein NT061_01015, partial [Spirochaetes bacterium]|nr:hypothetical protein [Spirochaetota bacterium]